CASAICLGGLCQAPSCGDGLKNGSETGVDCGGGCVACAAGTACAVAADCQSGVCVGGVCQLASCSDGVKNGSESDVDCGGSCPVCNGNATCVAAGDCLDGVCVGGHCQPSSCSDGVKNGDETGVDCGGACAVPEVCNGVDDDCDGSVDEGLGATTCGIGACQRVQANCVGGQLKSCVPGAPTIEQCDGVLDDDCDGVVDDGCDCVNGAEQGCYTGSPTTLGVGLCHGGTQTCALGQWGACAGELTPAAEICDGKDNDCNGQMDEGLGSTICGVGQCQVMVQNCVAGHAQSCTAGLPTAEICDGKDNDCNGQVDDGLGTISCGAGACATQAPACVNGAPGACNPHATDGVVCNDQHACTQNDACNNGACAGALIAAGTVCRASAGACDPAESCTGASLDCPADALSAAGTSCRAAAGVCDVVETCNGASTACPVDAVKVAGTVCRVSAGACDPAEACTGASTVCPADSLSTAGTVCRGSAGACDVSESCSGGSAACPANGTAAVGTIVGGCSTGLLGVCSAGNSTCNGSAITASCVQLTASSAESCDGKDNDCNGTVDNGASATCASKVCANGACQPATCADGVQNGTETGIDCGGGCPNCTVSGRYAIVDIDGRYASNGVTITEIVFLDAAGVTIPYVTTGAAAYNSTVNGLPSYWSSGIWDRSNLNDATISGYVDNSTGQTTTTFFDASTAAGWSRFIVDFSNTKSVAQVKLYTGSPESRIPHSISVYLGASFAATNYNATRSNAGFTLFGTHNYAGNETVVALYTIP
ncbi:MAG: MopE-related protein, partial [Minicystis sp.]